MKLGVFSVSLAVQDLEASRRFYAKLGFEEFVGLCLNPGCDGRLCWSAVWRVVFEAPVGRRVVRRREHHAVGQALLPGDGIGPEIVAEAQKVLDCLQQDFGLSAQFEHAPVGGAGFDAPSAGAAATGSSRRKSSGSAKYSTIDSATFLHTAAPTSHQQNSSHAVKPVTSAAAQESKQ